MGLYTTLGRYTEAEPLYFQALQVFHPVWKLNILTRKERLTVWSI
jgi:hypothetical protein